LATIQNVSTVDDLIKLNHVMVTCTDKRGLISNEGLGFSNFPSIGLLGRLAEINPDIKFISTGETFDYINGAGLNTIEIGNYTGFPEMKSGLVKSLHPKIHAGILGNMYTSDDSKYMRANNIPCIDAVIVNFYDLQKELELNRSFEYLRQAIDVGGLTLCHSSRKAFITTAIVTSIQMYPVLIEDAESHSGSVSLSCRLELAKVASKQFTEIMSCIDNVFNSLVYADLINAYSII